MLVQQLREVKGTICCICKKHSQSSVFQPSENFCFENFFSRPTMVDSIVDSLYDGISNALSVNSA